MIVGLKSSSVLILNALTRMHPDDRSNLRVEHLARQASISARTVQRHLRGLRALGYIGFEDTCGGRGHSYSIEIDNRVFLSIEGGDDISRVS